ncbi:MAG: hypothetical protein PHD55_05235, partial [Methanoregula sp.]|nr:hypothetical protein [Methanoregula sp.]
MEIRDFSRISVGTILCSDPVVGMGGVWGKKCFYPAFSLVKKNRWLRGSLGEKRFWVATLKGKTSKKEAPNLADGLFKMRMAGNRYHE